MVVADMDASENESALYTLWYRRSVIGYITMAAKKGHF